MHPKAFAIHERQASARDLRVSKVQQVHRTSWKFIEVHRSSWKFSSRPFREKTGPTINMLYHELSLFKRVWSQYLFGLVLEPPPLEKPHLFVLEWVMFSEDTQCDKLRRRGWKWLSGDESPRVFRALLSVFITSPPSQCQLEWKLTDLLYEPIHHRYLHTACNDQVFHLSLWSDEGRIPVCLFLWCLWLFTIICQLLSHTKESSRWSGCEENACILWTFESWLLNKMKDGGCVSVCVCVYCVCLAI